MKRFLPARTLAVLPILLVSAVAGDLSAGKAPAPVQIPADPAFSFLEGDDWATGSDILLGGIFSPNVHFSSAFGTSTGDPAELAAGHHDPNREGLTIQNIEFGTSMRAGDYLQGFATYAAIIDHDDKWAGSVEELFGKIVNLPGGFELRGGRYYNRFGFLNASHPHAYTFVNRDLLQARMVGEDSVSTEGGELAWLIPGSNTWSSAVSLSYGRVHLEEEEHEEHGEEPLFESEGPYFTDELFSADLRVIYRRNDFHQWTGLTSFLSGDNGYGRTTSVGSLGLEYLWRENGLEPGGRWFRWRAEGTTRQAGAVSTSESGESTTRKNLTESGLSTSAIYGFNEKFQTGVGFGYVEGISDAGLSERFRVSPMAQWNLARHVNLRLQYDYDHQRDTGGEHSVWLQFNASWGGPEVR